MNKFFTFLMIIFSFLSNAQRRNYFAESDKLPKCEIIEHGTFKRKKSNNNLSYKILFRKGVMKEIWGNNDIVIKNNYKMIDKCKFETEIKKIKTKYRIQDSLFYIGKKTIYEVVETHKNYIVINYWCNEGRNICSEILDRN